MNQETEIQEIEKDIDSINEQIQEISNRDNRLEDKELERVFEYKHKLISQWVQKFIRIQGSKKITVKTSKQFKLEKKLESEKTEFDLLTVELKKANDRCILLGLGRYI